MMQVYYEFLIALRVNKREREKKKTSQVFFFLKCFNILFASCHTSRQGGSGSTLKKWWCCCCFLHVILWCDHTWKYSSLYLICHATPKVPFIFLGGPQASSSASSSKSLKILTWFPSCCVLSSITFLNLMQWDILVKLHVFKLIQQAS